MQVSRIRSTGQSESGNRRTDRELHGNSTPGDLRREFVNKARE
jgi:hypothetical protein